MKAVLALMLIGLLVVFIMLGMLMVDLYKSIYNAGKRAGYQEFSERLDKIIQQQEQERCLPPEA
jgi:hypothetical protein